MQLLFNRCCHSWHTHRWDGWPAFMWDTSFGFSFPTVGNDEELTLTDVFGSDWTDVIATELLVAFVVVAFVIDVDDVDGADVIVGGYWKTFGCEAAFGVVIDFVSFVEFDAYNGVFATVLVCDWMLCGDWMCVLLPLLSLLLLFEFVLVVLLTTAGPDDVCACIVCGT